MGYRLHFNSDSYVDHINSENITVAKVQQVIDFFKSQDNCVTYDELDKKFDAEVLVFCKLAALISYSSSMFSETAWLNEKQKDEKVTQKLIEERKKMVKKMFGDALIQLI